jgi:hypothetical protein
VARSDIPAPKYQIGTLFKNLDTEQVYKLSEVRYDTYILVDKKGKESGESLFTLEYDYEVTDAES